MDISNAVLFLASDEARYVTGVTLPVDAGAFVKCPPADTGIRPERIAMTVSFETDIVPLFTSMDIDHMGQVGLALDDYSSMSRPAIASAVYEQVSSGGMPPSDSGEPPWSPDKVQLFKAWMDGASGGSAPSAVRRI